MLSIFVYHATYTTRINWDSRRSWSYHPTRPERLRFKRARTERNYNAENNGTEAENLSTPDETTTER